MSRKAVKIEQDMAIEPAVGCASAIASTTYQATGVRVRHLPIRVDKLLSRS
jgi:CO/xanthine dehydrogenase Mo-binding subunit